MKTLLQAIKSLRPLLDIEPETVIQEVLGYSAKDLLLKAQEPLKKEESQLLKMAVQRIRKGEPLQYVVGKTHFWKHEFRVGPGVLIPRPETEFLVEKLLQATGKVIELGAGSGNIGISVVLENPKIEWWALEKSPMAFAYAKRNASSLLKNNTNYHLLNQDFFEFKPKTQFDWIVSNPPYVSPQETFDSIIKKEPQLALFPGPTGLESIELVLKKSTSLLKPSGKLLLEIGSSQKLEVLRLLKKYPFSFIEVIKDYSGLDRVLVAQRNS